MARFVPILAVLAFGCNHAGDVTQPTAPQSTATTTTRPLPVVKPIELHYGIYLARFELRISVATHGTLRSVRTDGKRYGGNDIDRSHEQVEVREGPLTVEQAAELVRLFAGWDALSTAPYGGVPDGGDVSIRYGDKTVSGGSAVPKQVNDVRIRLMELARAMPVVKG